VSSALIPQLAGEFSRPKAIIRSLLLLGFFVFGMLALARPQWGSRLETVRRRGVDIMAALDTSYSMNTEDVVPSRLAKAKSEIRMLLDRLRGDRFGLTCFAGTATVECPLTLDYGAAGLFLDAVTTEIIPDPGTSLAAAIRTATSGFIAQERKYKVLVLFTDGEDLQGQVDSAVEQAREAGVIIYAMGIGSGQGMPIPVRDEKGDIIEYRKDQSGQVVVSRLDEQSLAKIASLTGGRYFRASASGSEIDDLYKDVSSLEKKELESRLFQNYDDQFQYPLAIAVLLLVLYGTTTDRRKPGSGWMNTFRNQKQIRSRADAVVGMLVLVAACFASVAGADAATVASKNKDGNKLFEQGKFRDAEKAYLDAQAEAPGRPELLYNLGNTMIKQKAYDQAVQSLSQAIGKADKGLQQHSWYNAGNALFEAGKYNDAAQAYVQALRLNPADRDAKCNLELTWRRLQQQKQTGSNQKQGQEKADNSSQHQQSGNDQKQNSGQQKEQQAQSPQNQDNKAANPQSTQADQKNGSFSKERALQILDALQNQELAEQRKLIEHQVRRKATGKDW
jgi:Ca-activated chloride channel homolog